MAAYRFPILVCHHFDGRCSAIVIEGATASAVGETASDAVREIKDYLQWKYRTEPWSDEPDFLEPVLSLVKVEIRPEYKQEERAFPCGESVSVRVASISGKDSGGLFVGVLPLLDVRFTYYDAKDFRGLVGHYAQSALKGLTPRQLSRYLLPPRVELDDVVIFVPSEERRRKSFDRDELLVTLPLVADPIGAREFRRQLSRPWERDAEVETLTRMLRSEQASVILLGESGVGKTAVLAEAARKAERDPGKPPAAPPSEKGRAAAVAEPFGDDAPAPPPKGRRFWLTGASRMIAGMKYLGQWQERVEEMIDELSERSGALCVENLLELVRTGGTGPADSIAAFLSPFIQRREIRIVAECTPAELDACRRLLPGFAELFQIVRIQNFTRTAAVAALDQLAGAQKQNLRIDIEPGSIDLVYRLFARFLPYQSFPGRAATFVINLFDAAGRRKGNPSIDAALIIERFMKQTGLPETFLRDDVLLEESAVIEALDRRVIGQPAACAAAAGIITMFKAGLNDPNRPLGVLLFCGPTGVGKTELARAMSDYLFGHGEQHDRMIRLDMSEYAGHNAADRLLIDPSGGGPSELVKRIRQQPFNLVLLDEVEKAAPEVFDVLLGVFDEGRLTDRFGRLTTFRSAIIIMTSNLGAGHAEPFGLSRSTAAPFESAVQDFFRPEFFNRLDAVVSFDALDEQTIRKIVVKELKALSERSGLQRAGYALTWTDRLIVHLAVQGFDRRYGARPLQRKIESAVVTPLARYLVEHPNGAGVTLRLDWSEDQGISLKAREE